MDPPIDLEEAEEVSNNNQDDDDEDAQSDGAVAGLRRSKRKRRNRVQTIYNFDNKAYQVDAEEGVLHINPAVLEQRKNHSRY